MSATDKLLWFAIGWAVATVMVMAYNAWNRKGSDARLVADLQSAQRELVRVRNELSTCNHEKLQAIADCHHEMLYRDRERRELASMVDRLHVIGGMCEGDDSDLARAITKVVDL